MDRRTFLGTLTGGLVAAPLAADAQPAGKVRRIGILIGSSASFIAPYIYRALYRDIPASAAWARLSRGPEHRHRVPICGRELRTAAGPRGNVTGASFFFPEIGVKRLELPKEGVPAVSRVLLIWNPANAVHEFVVKAIEAAATGLTWSSTSRRPRPSVSPSLRRSCSGRIR